MATTKNLDPPGAVDRGPTISIPHCEKGQAGIIDVISCFSFLGRDALTLRLRGGAFYGAFDEAFYRAFYEAFEEKARGSSRRRPRASRRRPVVFSKLNRGRKRRLHPLGEYIITLCTNGHTSKAVGLRVVDSHTGNHREDDFMPPKTFKGFPSAF
ncbi:hypothetical protein Tco_0200322, partial [Tanacetum coccineum]